MAAASFPRRSDRGAAHWAAGGPAPASGRTRNRRQSLRRIPQLGQYSLPGKRTNGESATLLAMGPDEARPDFAPGSGKSRAAGQRRRPRTSREFVDRTEAGRYTVRRGLPMGRSQVVRQRILVPPFGGSNPPAPANQSGSVPDT